MTEHVVDVREGQNSDGFDRYPYEEMEKQSLSIIVEGEKRSMYVAIFNFNLLCINQLHLFYLVNIALDL